MAMTLHRFNKNNSGSAIITVVIAMLFVVALGTALLFAAYMGMEVSVSARNEKERFYDAAGIMDNIKSGIQDEVTVALSDAYSTVLLQYSQGEYDTAKQDGPAGSSPEERAQNDLERIFVQSLASGTSDFVCKNEYDQLVLSETNIKTSFIPAATENTKTTLSIGASSYENSKISFKNIVVDRVAEGYESSVSSDIVIDIPQFFNGASISAALGEYAIIADTGVVAELASGAGHKITGSVFAGKSGDVGGIWTDKNHSDSILTLTGGNIISAGDIAVNGENSSINIDCPGYDVWTAGFAVAKLANLNVSGNCYVADDLEMNGGSNVKLSGSYYGFGSGTEANTSSSIAVNSMALNTDTGKSIPTKLDISKLDYLTLAGVNFLHPGISSVTNADDGSAASDIMTGQSIAIKTDQLAYLVPAAAITNYKTNPAVTYYEETTVNGTTSSVLAQPKFNTGAFLWSVNGAARTLNYYLSYTENGETKSAGKIVSYITQADGDNPQTLYCFISFTNQDKANEYFRDYFTAKPDTIKQYLDVYLDLTPSTNMTSTTKGNIYDKKSGSWSVVSGLGQSFSATLSNTYSTAFGENGAARYNSYINNAPTKEMVFKADNKNVAVVTNGNYTYSGGSALRLIVAAGDVTVTSPFSGIIVCGGTVHVRANISAADISDVRGAVCDDKPIEYYLKESLLGAQTSDKANAWSPDMLVKFENWQKS